MITLICGSMMAGKSSEMIRLLVRAKIAGKKTILIRPSMDDRGFLTHDKKTIDIKEISTDRLDYQLVKDYDVIGIDEAQFMPDNLLSYVNKIADSGKEVIICGLNGTSERKEFSNISSLIPYAEVIIKLNAICTECGSEYGAFSYFKDGNKSDDIKVGGSNEYTALCRKCYNSKGKSGISNMSSVIKKYF